MSKTRRHLTLLLLCTVIFLVGVTSLRAEVQHGSPDEAAFADLGIRFGVLSYPLLDAGPYSFATAIGPQIETPLPFFPSLHISTGLLIFSFAAEDPRFDDSIMLAPGVALSYPLLRGGEAGASWYLAPYLEQRHYIWEQRIDGDSAVAYRPMTALGLRMLQERERRILSGLGFEYLVAWDNEPVQLIGFYLQLGLRLGQRHGFTETGVAQE